jgi:hypothetical protein
MRLSKIDLLRANGRSGRKRLSTRGGGFGRRTGSGLALAAKRTRLRLRAGDRRHGHAAECIHACPRCRSSCGGAFGFGRENELQIHRKLVLEIADRAPPAPLIPATTIKAASRIDCLIGEKLRRQWMPQ